MIETDNQDNQTWTFCAQHNGFCHAFCVYQQSYINVSKENDWLNIAGKSE